MAVDELRQKYLGGANNSTSSTKYSKSVSELRDKYLGAEKSPNLARSTSLDNSANKSIPSLNTPSKTDTQIVADYENTPNYNFFQRLDKEKSEAYKAKQLATPEYEIAKANLTKDKIAKYGIDIDEMQSLYNLGNARSTDTAMRNYLKQKGVINEEDIKDIQKYLRVAKQNKDDERLTEMSDNHGFLGTLASVPLNLATSVAGNVQNTANFLTGKPLSNNDEANAMSRTVNNMRNAVSDDMGTLGQLGYGAATNALDLATSALTGGIGMAAEKAQNTMTNAIDRGLTADQALKLGVASGVTTYITEKIPMGKFEELAQRGFNLGKTPIKNIVETVASSMVAEGSQEMLEDIADSIADKFIAKDKSELRTQYNQLIANNVSPSEAAKQVFGDYVSQVLYDGLAGAISGGFLSLGGGSIGSVRNGIGNIRNNIANNNINNNANAEVQSEPINEANRPVANEVDNESAMQRRFAEEQEATRIPSLADYLERAKAIDEENAQRELAQQNMQNRFAEEEQANRIPNLADLLNQANQIPNSVTENVSENIPDNVAENVAEPIEYNTKKIEGNKELSKAISDHVNMYGKNDVAKDLHGQLNAAINEYADTYSDEAYNKIMQITSQLEKMLEGQTYTTVRSKDKRSGKMRQYTYPGNRGTVTEIVTNTIDSMKRTNEYKQSADIIDVPISKETFDNISNVMSKRFADIDSWNEYKAFQDSLNSFAESNDEEYLAEAIEAYDNLARRLGTDFLNETNADFEQIISDIVDLAENGPLEDLTVPTLFDVPMYGLPETADKALNLPNEERVALRGYSLNEAISELTSGKDVSIEELENIPQIQKAQAQASAKTANGFSYEINTPERQEMRKSAVDEIMNRGSYSGVDKNGKEKYSGDVARDKKVIFVTGLPAAGKSTTVNPLSQFYKARIIDSDDVKTSPIFAEDYDNGYGAHYLHKESKMVVEEAKSRAEDLGENVIYPIIGDDYQELLDEINYYEALGYEPAVVYVDLPNNKALGRALQRFLDKGRFIPLNKLQSYGNKPYETFTRLVKGEGDGTGLQNYAEVSNDVKFGEKPIFQNGQGTVGQYYSTGQRNSRNGKSTESRTNKTFAESTGTRNNSSAESRSNRASKKSDTIYTGNVRENAYANNLHRTDIDESVIENFKENPQMYVQLKNADTKAKAEKILELGFNEAYQQYSDLLEAKDPVAIPLGYALAQQMVDEGNHEGAIRIVEEMSTALTEGGQFTQAAAITMLKSNPMAALRLMQKQINRVNKNGAEQYGKKWKDFSLTKEEIDSFGQIEPGDTKAIQSLFESITKRMSDSYPSTLWEKIVESTKTSMMLNPRTHIRNIAANTAMLPVRSLTDRVSALGQNIVHLINPDTEVTQSLVGGTRAQKNIANQIFDEQIKPRLEGDSKWEDVANNVSRGKQVFKDSRIGAGMSKGVRGISNAMNTLTNGKLNNLIARMDSGLTDSVLENLRRFDYFLLGEVEDDPFVKKNFSNRLASYMKAQNINSMDSVPQEAIETAYLEALKATFKDDNYLTRAFSSIKKNTGKFGEVALPFVKTPANLAKRGIEYSPIGFIESIKNARGKEANALVDDLAKNAVGTIGIYLGYLLAKSGRIKGALSDDKDEAMFEKQQGQQAFSVDVGGKYYTFDWAQPASIPLVIGATINDAIKESDEENANYLNIAKQSVIAAGDAWVGLSPLSSLRDILGGSEYSSDSATENVLNEVTEFPQRLIPSLSGAIARTTDTTMRNTYSKNNPTKTWVDQAKAKIPGLSKTLPASYDTWGNERKRQDSTASAAFAQFVNPGTLGYDASTPIDREIGRLGDIDRAAYPYKAAWSVTIGDKKINLDNRQYSDYQRIMGRYAYTMTEAFLNSDSYKGLDDSERIKALGKIYSLAKSMAENDLFDKPIANTNKKLYETYQTSGKTGVAKYLGTKK